MSYFGKLDSKDKTLLDKINYSNLEFKDLLKNQKFKYIRKNKRIIIAAVIVTLFLFFQLSKNSNAESENSKLVTNISESIKPLEDYKPNEKVPVNNSRIYTYPEEDSKIYPRRNATFVTLARNSDLRGLLKSIQNAEDHFNRFYHYDWVFLNNEEFSEEFKYSISSVVSGNAQFGVIPREHWSYPDWIDQQKAANNRASMEERKIIYGGSESYRHMCRYESGFFYRHPLLENYQYYWRVEPDVQFPCNIDFDVFAFMEDNKKDYAFTISLLEFPATIETLWQTTKDFMKEHPDYIAPDNLMKFVSDNNGESYNLCHFWSNFEIANLDLWRSEAYSKYFDYLDKTGGFFYERWGDAPVHSIAASLFLPADKIHRFDNIGYYHNPFTNCPTESLTRKKLRCSCTPSDNFSWRRGSCAAKYYDASGNQRPIGWESQPN